MRLNLDPPKLCGVLSGRRWLSGAPRSERGIALDELLHAAEKVADELRHN